MTVSTINPSVFSPRLWLDNIVIMEDDENMREVSKEMLESLNFEVREVENASDAINLADSGIKSYILDINMRDTGGKDQEGLDALEVIKEIDDMCFVGIISGYSTKYKSRAENLHVNFFREKTSDRKADVYAVIESLYKYVHEQLHNVESSGSDELEDDINISSFQRCMSNMEWRESNIGKFVAFVNGILVDMDKDKNRLISRVRGNYQEDYKFITEVTNNNDSIYDVPDRIYVDAV